MACRITVEVVRDEDGAPIEDALVQLDLAKADSRRLVQSRTWRTDALGRAILEVPADAASEAILFVRARGRDENADPFEHPVDLTVAEQQRVVRLKAGRTYAGVVRDESGNLVSDAEVRVTLASEASTASARRGDFLPHMRTDRSCPYRIRDGHRTDAAGRFELLDVIPSIGKRPGSWTIVLSIHRVGFVTRIVRGIEQLPESAAGEVTLELVLERGRELHGRVVDEQGNAIEGASITACRTDSGAALFFDSEVRAVSDRAGRFTLEALEHSDQRLTVEAPEFERSVRLVDCAVAELPQIEFRLPAGGALDGTLQDEHGAPVANAHISLQFEDRWRLGASTRTDADGRFRFAGIPAAERRAVLYQGLRAVAVELPGRGVLLRFLQDRQIEFALVDAASGSPVHFADEDEISRSTFGSLVQGASSRALFFDREGRAKSAYSPVGELEIHAIIRGYRPLSLRVPAEQLTTTTPFELKLERGITVEGRIFDANGQPASRVVITEFAAGFIIHSLRTATDRSGHFRLEGCRRDGILIVEASEHAVQVIGLETCEIGSDGAMRLSFQLRRGGTIQGSVRRADGSFCVGEDVRVKQAASGWEIPGAFDCIGADGRFRVEHVLACPVHVCVRDHAHPVEVAEGDVAEVEIVLPSRPVVRGADSG